MEDVGKKLIKDHVKNDEYRYINTGKIIFINKLQLLYQIINIIS